MLKLKKTLTLALTLILIFSLATPAFAKIALPANEAYEIKVLLDPKVALNSDGILKQEVLDLFKDANNQSAKYDRTVAMQYLDSVNPNYQKFRSNDWFVRIRHRTEKGGNGKAESFVQLTYRKRYPLAGVNQSAINAALAKANADFTGYSTTGWEAQVDWGAKPVLSVSRNIDVNLANIPADERNNVSWSIPTPARSGTLQLPKGDRSRTLLQNNVPAIFTANGPFTGGYYISNGAFVYNTYVFGPTHYIRYSGVFRHSQDNKIHNIPVDIEVMKIQYRVMGVLTIPEYVVEASLKVGRDTFGGEPLGVHANFTDLFQNRYRLPASLTGIYLSNQNGLKTATVLDKYPGTA